jgi:hypothetical protein
MAFDSFVQVPAPVRANLSEQWAASHGIGARRPPGYALTLWFFAMCAAVLFMTSCSGVVGSSSAPPGSTLAASPASVNFGQVNVGSNSSQRITLSTAGSGNVTISAVNLAGAGFTLGAVQLPATIASKGTFSLTVEFLPSSGAQYSGSVSVVSTATNSPLTVSLSGTGVAATGTHSATIAWDPGGVNIVSYDVFRSLTSGGPYTQLNTSPVTVTSYTDNTVQAGGTYYYVVTETNSAGGQSKYSSEVSAAIP